MRAVVLVLVPADRALEAGPDLRTNTDAVALLDGLDVLAHADGLADNLVAYAEGALELSPSAGDGVDVGPADAAALDLDVNVGLGEGLGLELGPLELVPCLGRVDGEALKGVWVSHFGCDVKVGGRCEVVCVRKMVKGVVNMKDLCRIELELKYLHLRNTSRFYIYAGRTPNASALGRP